jgi:hypothetical protein
VENGQTHHAADEAEVVEMFRVNGGVGIYLKGIIIVCRVFKQAKRKM